MTGSLWVPSAHSDQSAHYQGPGQVPNTQKKKMEKGGGGRKKKKKKKEKRRNKNRFRIMMAFFSLKC